MKLRHYMTLASAAFLLFLTPLSVAAKKTSADDPCPLITMHMIFNVGGQVKVQVLPSTGDSYKFIILPFGSAAPNEGNWASEPSQVSALKVFTGLNNGDSYSIYARMSCSGGTPSNAIQNYTHTAPCVAPTITGVTYSNESFINVTSTNTAPFDPNNYVKYIITAPSDAPSENDWLTAPLYSSSGSLGGVSLYQNYRIHARYRCESGTMSEIASQLYTHNPTCNYPNIFTTAGYNSTTITFSPPIIIPSWLTQMEYQLSTVSDFSSIERTITVNTSAMPYTFSGLNGNTDYYLRRKPLCTCATICAYSTPISFRTLDCQLPTINNLTFSTPTDAILNFTYPSFTTYVTGYEYAVTTSSAAPMPSDWIATPTTGNKTLTGLTMGNSYFVHVRTICGSFNDTRTVQAYTHNPSCTTPTLSLTAAYTTGAIMFSVPSWISQVEYQVSTSATFEPLTTTTATAASTASPIALSGLMQGTLYYVRIRSICPLATCSTPCNWADNSVLTQLCYETLQLTQRANSTNRLVFHWIAPVGAMGQQYNLTNTATSAVVTSGTLGGSDGDVTLTGLSLAAGTEYAFSLRTQCSAADFSTYKTTPFTACNAPTTLPYSIDFSTFATDALPCSWQTQGDMMNEGWRVGASFMPGPLTNRLIWAQDMSDNDWAYSPNLNFSVGDYELLLDFSTIQSGATSKFQVYLTDSYDPSVFTVSGTKIFEHLANSADRTNLGIPFTVGSAGAKHLVFHGEQGVQVIDIRKLTVRAAPAASDLSVAEYGNDDVCQTFYAYNVSGNGWYHIYNNSGEVLASLNPLGAVNLGTVTLQLRDASAVQRYTNAAGTVRHVLPRHFSFSSSAIAHGVAFGSSVQVRLYFSEAEMTALRTASGLPSLTSSNITITHFSPPTVDCDIANNLGVGTAEVVVATAATAIAGGNHSLQFGVSHFSEFTPHTPSATPLSAIALPLDLLSFQGKLLNNNTSSLTWITANVSKVTHFDVERSVNGVDFIKIGTVKIEKNENSYTFTDNLNTDATAANTLYYRLKINDLDGSSIFSRIISLEKGKILRGVKIYPNPVSDVLTIENAEGQAIEIINVLGQVVQTFQKLPTFGKLIITDLPNGVYFLKTANETVRFVKR